MKGSNYITIGYNFLQLTINSINELVNQGNRSLVITSGNKTDEEAWKEYEVKTKWNDQNIAIPVLFNFFHGTELVLKGLILHCGGVVKRTHRLTVHLESLRQCPNPPNESLLNHLQKIISDNGLEDFFKTNNSSVDSFYELFRYPEMNNGREVEFWMLRGEEEIGIKRFEEIRLLASSLKPKIKEWKTSTSE
jgi:HEPN domain-containing protein